jgi:hypothetical protein
VLRTVEDIDGVKSAGGNIVAEGTAPVKADGKAVTSSFGPPLLGVNYTGVPELDKLIPIEGRLPEGGDEFAMDIDSAKDNDFVVGQTYTVVSPTAGPRQFTLTGTMAFNSLDNDTLGAVLTIFDTPTAQDFLGRPGEFDTIAVIVDDDTQLAQTSARIQEALPGSLEVVDREVTTQEQKDDFGQISASSARSAGVRHHHARRLRASSTRSRSSSANASAARTAAGVSHGSAGQLIGVLERPRRGVLDGHRDRGGRAVSFGLRGLECVRLAAERRGDHRAARSSSLWSSASASRCWHRCRRRGARVACRRWPRCATTST